MFCKQCGHQIDDNAVQCNYCGTPVHKAGEKKSIQVEIPSNININTQSYTINNMRDYMIHKGSSVLFLSTAACMALTIILNIIAAGRAGGSMISTILGYMSRMGLLDEMGLGYGDLGMIENALDSYMNSMRSASITSVIIGSIPLMLVIAALWLIYSSAKTNFANGVTGFKILRILNLISFIAYIALAVIFAIVGLIITAAAESSVGIIVAIILDGSLAFKIVYYKKICDELKKAMDVIQIGAQAEKISTYLLVITIVSCVFNVLKIFGSFSFIGLLTSIVSVAPEVIFIMIMLDYNKKVTELQMNGSIIMDVRELGGIGGSTSKASSPAEYRPVQPEAPVVDNSWNNISYTPAPAPQYDEDRTVALKEDIPYTSMPSASLIYVDNNEVVSINKNPFVLGKSKDKADYVITTDPYVSRVHAQIIYQDGAFYIKDLGSTNHTYLNGNTLLPNELTRLNHEDQIFISRVPFVFVLN